MLLLVSGFFGSAQTRVVTGLLISDENAQPVALANIVNKTRAKRSLTNRQGYFHINVSPEDSLVFSSVGFDALHVSGTELLNEKSDTIMLLLHAGSYRLRDVTIIYSNRKRDSIARVVAKIMKDDTLLNNNDRILRRPRGSPQTSSGLLGYSGALTEMYYQFSKEGKDMVHFEEFVGYYREVQEADKRYNKQIIAQMTHLPDYTLDEYILFCKMERKFIIEASDYDLVKAIKECEGRFREANNLK